MENVLIRFVDSKKKLNVQDYEEYFHNKVIQKVKTIKKEDCEYKYFDLQEYKNIMLYDCNYELDFLKNGINIDNISLYYEFMSDDDKLNNSILLDKLFNRRMGVIYFNLKIDNFTLWLNDILSYKADNNDFMINCSIFGIIDTLKPIDEYIEQIKQSEAYKEYIAKKA